MRIELSCPNLKLNRPGSTLHPVINYGGRTDRRADIFSR
jgi:hypothetical protein